MKAKCMLDKVLHPQYKKLALVLAVAWGSPLLVNQALARDKPPVMVVEPSTAATSVIAPNNAANASSASIAPTPSITVSTVSNIPNKAQENDLLQLYRQAALSDPVFNSARYSFLAGKEKKWQGLSVLLPQVAATGSETKNDFTKRGSAEQTYMTRGWTVKLTQPLLNWDKWEQFGQGNLNSAIAEAQFAAAEQDLVLRVTEAYFNVLNAQDSLNLSKNKKALIGEQLEQAKRNFEVGTSTITDTHEAQSRYDLVFAQELAAEADLLIKRSALEQLTGSQIGDLKSLSANAKIEVVAKERKIKLKNNEKPKKLDIKNVVALEPGQSMSDWVNQAEQVSYSIMASKLAYDVATKETKRAYAGHAPSVDLVAQRGYTDSESLNTATGNIYPQQSFSNQIIVQVTVPLFSSGYNQSVVREKSALASKALADLENTRRSAAQATRQAYLGFNNGLAQVKAYEAAEISALSALESNKLGYEVGVRINIDVLNAQDTLFTTRRDLAKARYDTILNGLKLKAQAAVLSDEDLQSVNALLK
jgi:outer membrane protein